MLHQECERLMKVLFGIRSQGVSATNQIKLYIFSGFTCDGLSLYGFLHLRSL